MISLRKGMPPEWLVRNQATKTADYIAAPVTKKPSPWRIQEILDGLRAESMRKCMYCESTVDDVAYAAVEHIRPKSVFEELVLEWANLGLVCPRCNTNKGTYWSLDEDHRLLNPYEDDIEHHVTFRGPLTVARLSSTRARLSVRKLQLSSRSDLLISRMRSIEDLNARLELWADAENPDLRALYAEHVEAALASDREYTGVLRAYAREAGFPVTE